MTEISGFSASMPINDLSNVTFSASSHRPVEQQKLNQLNLFHIHTKHHKYNGVY